MSHCTRCANFFINDKALHAHCRDKADHPYCVECERLFVTSDAYDQHVKNAAIHRDDGSDDSGSESFDTDSDSDAGTQVCTSCDKNFRTGIALHDHCTDKLDHPYCVPCRRLFVTLDGLDQHLQNATVHRGPTSSDDSDSELEDSDSEDESHVCGFCDKELRTASGLHAHSRDKDDHPYCVECKRLFGTFESLEQHRLNASVHKDEDSDSDESDSDSESNEQEDDVRTCVSCKRDFVDQRALFMHLHESSLHNWCFICSRDFSSQIALNQHHSSRVHESRTFDCPICSKTFNVPSAIAHHIESGCHKVTRHQVTNAVHRAVRSLKIIPSISLSHRVENGSPARTTTTYTATSLAFNGTAYECYLCHHIFRTLPSLNAHLASPAHDEEEFKCPKCKKRFTVVSALVQHIESEVCGLAKFKQVEDYASALTDQFTRLLKI